MNELPCSKKACGIVEFVAEEAAALGEARELRDGDAGFEPVAVSSMVSGLGSAMLQIRVSGWDTRGREAEPKAKRPRIYSPP